MSKFYLLCKSGAFSFVSHLFQAFPFLGFRVFKAKVPSRFHLNSTFSRNITFSLQNMPLNVVLSRLWGNTNIAPLIQIYWILMVLLKLLFNFLITNQLHLSFLFHYNLFLNPYLESINILDNGLLSFLVLLIPFSEHLHL